MKWRALWRNFKRPFIIASIIFVALWINDLITSEDKSIVRIDGGFLGVAYHISYIDSKERNFKQAIDSLLGVINGSVASYINTSPIARINDLNDTAKGVPVNHHFRQLFRQTNQLHKETNGFFKPGLRVLMDDSTFRRGAHSTTTDSLPLHIPSQHFSLVKTNEKMAIQKRYPKAKLNFDAIAKGYSADVVANFLERHDIDHYLIDIGGQILARGRNQRNEHWQAAPAMPSKYDTSNTNRNLQFVVKLKNEAMATVHKPITQEFFVHASNNRPYNEQKPSDFISVSILSDRSCIKAQAWAIAFHFMGLARAWRYVQNREELSAYLIYKDSTSGALQTRYTQDMADRFIEKEQSGTHKQ